MLYVVPVTALSDNVLMEWDCGDTKSSKPYPENMVVSAIVYERGAWGGLSNAGVVVINGRRRQAKYNLVRQNHIWEFDAHINWYYVGSEPKGNFVINSAGDGSYYRFVGDFKKGLPTITIRCDKRHQ